MQARPLSPRLVRGLSAALLTTFAALLGHIAGGGVVPSLAGLAAPFALSALASTALVGRRLSPPRLVAAVVASQVLFHNLFVLGADGAAASHAHHGAAMWISHLAVAVVTASFLYRGELALHGLRELGERLTAWLRHRLAVPELLPVAVAPARIRVSDARGATGLSQIHASTLSHRGPPAAPRIAR